MLDYINKVLRCHVNIVCHSLCLNAIYAFSDLIFIRNLALGRLLCLFPDDKLRLVQRGWLNDALQVIQ